MSKEKVQNDKVTEETSVQEKKTVVLPICPLKKWSRIGSDSNE